MNIEKETKLFKSSKIYSLCVALLPVFATYASGIPGFSVADIILVIFTGYALICGRKDENRFSCNIELLFLGMFLIVLFDFISFFSPDAQTIDVIIRTIRYFFYILCFVYTSRKLIYVEALIKYVQIVSVCAVVFILIQYVMYRFFGVIISGFLSGLKLYVAQYATTNYAAHYQMMYRPTSFFLEPAHFARYATIGLTLYLWDKELSIKKVIIAVFISCGILLSTSSQGYLLMAIVWALFLLVQVKRIKNKNLKKLIYIAIPLAPIVLMMIFKLPAVQSTIARTLAGDIDNKNTAIGARLSGFLFYSEMSVLEKIFGNGFGSIPNKAWLSSAAYWLYGSGVIVFIIYVIFMVSSIFKVKNSQRIILFIFFILFFSDDSFYSYMCVLFFSLSLLSPRDDYIFTKEKKYEINPVHSN